MYLCTKLQEDPKSKFSNESLGGRGTITSNTIDTFMECAGGIHAGRKEGTEKHPASHTWPSKGALNAETKTF